MFRPLSLFQRHRNTPALRDDGDSISQLHREMNRLFDDFFSDDGSVFGLANNDGARPAHIDYIEKDNAIELQAELPGIDEDDIHVELNDNLLTIRGEKKIEEEDKNGLSRRAWSSFHRAMSLPFDVDPDAIEATFKNGVLKLNLPKPPELTSRARKIEVQRG